MWIIWKWGKAIGVVALRTRTIRWGGGGFKPTTSVLPKCGAKTRVGPAVGHYNSNRNQCPCPSTTPFFTPTPLNFAFLIYLWLCYKIFTAKKAKWMEFMPQARSSMIALSQQLQWLNGGAHRRLSCVSDGTFQVHGVVRDQTAVRDAAGTVRMCTRQRRIWTLGQETTIRTL